MKDENPVKAILENLRLNETKSIDLGDGKSAYQYGGKYYIKSGDTKKEISSDQYNKLLNKNIVSNDSSAKSYSDELDSTISSKLGIGPKVKKKLDNIIDKFIDNPDDFEYTNIMGEKDLAFTNLDKNKISNIRDYLEDNFPKNSYGHYKLGSGCVLRFSNDRLLITK